MPYKKNSKNGKHFMILGLTVLTGETLMCVMNFAGKHRDKAIELGIESFAEEIGLDKDRDSILKNKGPERHFPGSTTCNYRGKDIPCMYKWSEKG